MLSRVIIPLMGLAGGGLIALALVWPQGLGSPSPAPFGHPMSRSPSTVEQARDLARRAGLRAVD
jgi:hypothetical protein